MTFKHRLESRWLKPHQASHKEISGLQVLHYLQIGDPALPTMLGSSCEQS
jgi:hypothetical protein